MAIQKKILTSNGCGVLALGKPGDIATRAYGPVVRAVSLSADTAFGAFVTGKGILVNSNDCAGIGSKLDTVYGLKAGQVGSVLVSGAAIVKKSQLSAINSGMNVQDTFGDSNPFDANDWKEVAAFVADKQYWKGDYVSNKVDTTTTYYVFKEDYKGAFDTTKLTSLGTTADAYSTTSTYTANSVVTYNSKVYANPAAIDYVVEVEVNGLA